MCSVPVQIYIAIVNIGTCLSMEDLPRSVERFALALITGKFPPSKANENWFEHTTKHILIDRNAINQDERPGNMDVVRWTSRTTVDDTNKYVGEQR